MTWLAVDRDKNENIFKNKPCRVYNSFWWDYNVNTLNLPKGSIEKIIGKHLTWEDKPIELKVVIKKRTWISKLKKLVFYKNKTKDFYPLTFQQCLKEEFLINTQDYPKEYHDLFYKKFQRAEKRFKEQ